MRSGLCARSTRLPVADRARYRNGVVLVKSFFAGTVEIQVRGSRSLVCFKVEEARGLRAKTLLQVDD